MTITATYSEERSARTELDRRAISVAGRLLVTGAWVERQVARRLRDLLG